MDILPPPNGYLTRAYGSPLPEEGEAQLLMDLLDKYGSHYKHHFAVDMRARLSPRVPPEEFSSSSSSATAATAAATTFRGVIGAASYPSPTPTDTGAGANTPAPLRPLLAASNCNIIHDHRLSLRPRRACRDVGLFGSVITDSAHRRRGLSGHLVSRVLHQWDKLGGGVLVLGTGSRHAAKTYQRNGFVHLAGGLDAGEKGFNPDDEGETIMVRPPATEFFMVKLKASKLVFDKVGFARKFYGGADFAVEPLSRAHFAELVLLLNMEAHNTSKLTAAGITDGVHVEEKIVALINKSEQLHRQEEEEEEEEGREEDDREARRGRPGGGEHMRPIVVYDVSNRRVHGIAVANAEERVGDFWGQMWENEEDMLVLGCSDHKHASTYQSSARARRLTYAYVVPFGHGSAKAKAVLELANGMKERARVGEALSAAKAAKIENEVFLKELAARSSSPISPHLSKASIVAYERDLGSRLDSVLSLIEKCVDPLLQKLDTIRVAGGFWV